MHMILRGDECCDWGGGCQVLYGGQGRHLYAGAVEQITQGRLYRHREELLGHNY